MKQNSNFSCLIVQAFSPSFSVERLTAWSGCVFIHHHTQRVALITHIYHSFITQSLNTVAASPTSCPCSKQEGKGILKEERAASTYIIITEWINHETSRKALANFFGQNQIIKPFLVARESGKIRSQLGHRHPEHNQASVRKEEGRMGIKQENWQCLLHMIN